MSVAPSLIFTRSEICIYFAVYLLYLIYGFYCIAKARASILDGAAQEFFANSWHSLLGQKYDFSNHELQNFANYMLHWWHWYVLHACTSLLSKLLLWQQKALQHIVQATLCLLALLCNLQLISTMILAIMLFSFYCIAQLKSKHLVWLLASVWMILVHLMKNSEYGLQLLGYAEYFTFLLLISWTILRCCSYALNFATCSNPAKYSLSSFLGYTLYFPTLIYGPFLSFPRYAVLFDTAPVQQPLKTQLGSFFFNLARAAVWWLVLHILLHFLYVHYMAIDASAVEAVGGAFTQHAVGYYMGHMFYLYYVVTYGLGIAFAHFDGLNPPKGPRCIGRIHFYSNMWKFFDEGLYEFLFLHIYREVRSESKQLFNKLCATAATFAFVYVWHGCYEDVLLWSALNFLCLVLEKAVRTFFYTSAYYQYVERGLTDNQAARLRALFASQLFIPAAFSNIYFISGRTVGDLLMRGAYCSGILNYLALTVCSYCFFMCSELITQKLQPL